MTTCQWISTPIGIDASRWATRPGRRTVLVAVHTIVSCHRLLDVVDHVESDPRIQVVYAVAPDVFNRQVEHYLNDLGALVVSWEQATKERFDLALAAAYNGLDEIHAPLIVLAHGAGFAKLTRPRERGGAMPAQPPVYGLDAQRLTRDGTALASAIVLAHHSERDVLSRQCPQALPVAVVAGDPCYDRLAASLSLRSRYREALGIADRQLVVVSSTWGPDGLFGQTPDLLPWIMNELPDDSFRVAALLHPAVWSAHGHRQIRAWTRDCREAGLMLLDPTEDWRALVVAADYLIGDHGSVTAYGAGIGLPVLHLAPDRPNVISVESAQWHVTSTASRLDLKRPLIRQLRGAPAADRDAVAAALTSCPGQAGSHIRRTMYQLLRLAEPGRHRLPTPVPAPRTGQREVAP